MNRFAYPQSSGGESVAASQPPKSNRVSASPRQSVNISEETMMRLARSKLARAMTRKLAYNQQGAIESRLPAGSQFSARA
ncbi:hypothetical protein [Pelagicoccus sp. SDUM812003]|uniref:hypothetical protein n=1 Tax=Pelagicoccus sp. SDUM812003 TaxID=3041267 RepID=UPI00281106A4|nr:hypothetical protein [Pelagicoccus sp. SDUM812003]